MIRLTGAEAIEHAEAHNLTLSKYTDPTEEARDGLTPDEAREIAMEDPELIYVNLDEPLQGDCVTPATLHYAAPSPGKILDAPAAQKEEQDWQDILHEYRRRAVARAEYVDTLAACYRLAELASD